MHATRTVSFLAFLAVVGCGSAPPPTGSNPSAPPPVASAAPAEAGKPAAKGAPGSELVSCGKASRTLQDLCPADAANGAACFVEAAVACRTAEYVETSQTDEGGTVVSRYLVEAKDGGCAVVIETDWTKDPFGPAPHTRTECRSAELALATSGCKVLHTLECGEDVPTP